MPKYIFTAVGSKGEERTGSVEAASADLASSQIKSMGYFPTNLKLEQEGPLPSGSQKAPAVRQFRHLLKRKRYLSRLVR